MTSSCDIWFSWWWCHSAETLSTSITLCEAIPLVFEVTLDKMFNKQSSLTTTDKHPQKNQIFSPWSNVSRKSERGSEDFSRKTSFFWASIHLAIITRLIVRSREVSNPRDMGLYLFNRSEISDRRLGNSAAEAVVNFQYDTLISTPNLAASRLHEMWW